MNIHNLTQLFKKLAIITGIVSVSAFATVPVRASNGVIHAVNRVLLPQQLRQTIASRLAMQ